MKKIYFLALGIFASVSLMATQVKVAAGADLQAAVNGASSGDTVLVQAGTYKGNFTMKDGVYVSGGWNEDFTAQTEHASILDANASGRVLNQPADFTTLTIWDNFTIQNGKLTAADGGKNLGAGVALMQKGRVINCLIQNNTFDYSGNCIGGGIGQDVGLFLCLRSRKLLIFLCRKQHRRIQINMYRSLSAQSLFNHRCPSGLTHRNGIQILQKLPKFILSLLKR